ncbi:MAG: protein 5 [Xinjiang varicosavirus]|uniref:Protein 5 n=1 Tax=Xinjiang varicosavirus TaxID=3071319 RepID=A0AAJ4PCV3_9RHAB|nr:MAG: protein 5 [Xinjiang varicosa-like virus]QYF49874.1 MAG: protein 5 [Xinjiang varicosa-like virus]
MDGRCHQSILSFHLKNKVVTDIFKDFKGVLTPVFTSLEQSRVYQEISICFLFISMISESLKLRGAIRMSDKLGSDADSLCSISWTSTSQMWGFMMSPVAFLSGEIGDRLMIHSFVSADSHPEGATLASARVLIRIGTRAPISRLSEIFNWPSSREFESGIFSTDRQQDAMLNMISSYYSKGKVDGSNIWEDLSALVLPKVSCNLEELAMKTFPCFSGCFNCYPRWILNYLCMDKAYSFRARVMEMLQENLGVERPWNDCKIKWLFDHLCAYFPQEIHVGHIQDYGAHSIAAMRRVCSEQRNCWVCKSELDKGTSAGPDNMTRILTEREGTGTPIRSLLTLLGNVLSDPNIPLAILSLIGVVI